MMLKPSIDKLLDKVPSKYSLVILQAKRAHELAAGAEPTQEFTSVKPTLQALEEIETGNVWHFTRLYQSFRRYWCQLPSRPGAK